MPCKLCRYNSSIKYINTEEYKCIMKVESGQILYIWFDSSTENLFGSTVARAIEDAMSIKEVKSLEWWTKEYLIWLDLSTINCWLPVLHCSHWSHLAGKPTETDDKLTITLTRGSMWKDFKCFWIKKQIKPFSIHPSIQRSRNMSMLGYQIAISSLKPKWYWCNMVTNCWLREKQI